LTADVSSKKPMRFSRQALASHNTHVDLNRIPDERRPELGFLHRARG
jgi:hypothetical protein